MRKKWKLQIKLSSIFNMHNINYLYQGINLVTIPDIIYKELSKHGDEKSFKSYKDKTGKQITEYGNLMPPFKTYFNYGEFGFWCLEKYYKIFQLYLKKGQYFDLDLNQLNAETIMPYLNEYAKGFEDGYIYFEEKIKQKNNIFSITNEQIAHKVFSRIYGFVSVETGNFKYGGLSKETEQNELKQKYNIDFVFIIKKDLLYQSGFGGGGFFKAWEIILNNPTLFKSIFEENITYVAPSIIKEEITMFFPPMHKVFFVHYQCEDFNIGEKIISLGIYNNGKATLFSVNELENIISYSKTVNQLLDEGLILVHWNQDRPNFGSDHINKRYNELTGLVNTLDYKNCINLAELLINKYGQDYIEHPRLDNLAKANQFHGIRETQKNEKIFDTNRLLLLSKIFFNASKETLKFKLNIKSTNVDAKQEKTLTNFYFKINAGASKKIKATTLFEALEKDNHVDITSKNDFINGFIGNVPDNKINWKGNFGDLKSFINYSISEKLIENVSKKWVYTANFFTHNGIHFNNNRIKDAARTINDDSIKKIVRSIL